MYLRARHYAPNLGLFKALDLLEDGNRYIWVQGDVISRVDPSGMIDETPGIWDTCQQTNPCVPTPTPTGPVKVHATPDNQTLNCLGNCQVVCAGDRIGFVITGDTRENSDTDHLHFAYRSSRAGYNAVYRDPRLFFSPTILMTRTDIINYRIATPTSSPSSPTPHQ